MSLPTKDVLSKLDLSGIDKAERSGSKTLALAVMAGAFIGFAALLATTSATGWSIEGADVFYGPKKILFGAVFSTGLMLVLIPGGDLFTGNILMTLPLFKRDISVGKMLRNWLLVWGGNFIGALLLAWIVAGPAGLMAGKVGETAMKVAAAKCGLTGIQIFSRAVLANWIVCLAVMMAYSAKDTAGKIWAIFFPIMGFAAVGFEHSIANMYFVPVALFTKIAQGTDHYQALTAVNGIRNILIATVGNILGGALPVAAFYHRIHRSEEEEV
ncbi:MAG: formate/nitrite transporter family protein [Spirochaetales bacterium]|nr:formate/nitrite transporter family protein [Spirochaetales bacterium]